MRKAIDRSVEWLLVVMMALMVINVSWQVLSRFVVGSPSTFTEEAARYLMIWLGFIGGSYVAGKKGHPAIELLALKFGETGKRRLALFIQLLIAAFAVLALIIGGSYLVFLTFALNQTSAALQVPIGLVYLSIPLSGVLLLYYSLTALKQS